MSSTTGQTCSFCHRAVSDTDPLYTGPAGIAIRPQCVAPCGRILEPPPPADVAAVRITQQTLPYPAPSTPARLHCSFCRRQQTDVARLIAGPHGIFICDFCVR